MADRIDFVEEEDDGGVGARSLEEFVEVSFRFTEVARHDIANLDVHERGAELAGESTGDVGLAASGRAVEQQAAVEALAVELADLRVAQGCQEGHGEAVLDRLHAAHVGQRRRHVFKGPRVPFGFLVNFDFAFDGPRFHECGRRSADLLLGVLPVEVFRIGAVGGSGVILPISGLARRRTTLLVPFLGRLREGLGMYRHDRGNVCVVRGGGCGGRRSGLLGRGEGVGLVRGGGRGLRFSGVRPVDGRGRGLGHAEGAAHEGRDALIVRVDGEDDGEVGDGFGAPPLGDEEFGEMLAQGMVLGSLFDDRHEGVDERIRHAISLPAGRLLGLCAHEANRAHG